MKKFVLTSVLATMAILISLTNCSQNKTDEAELEKIREQGAMIVDTTFKTLSGALMSAVKDSGVVYAIHYCNLNAFPLVDALSEEYNVTINRRTTLARNENNRADRQDMVHNTGYIMQMRQGQELTPNLVEHKNGYTYYQPIMVAPQCLVCHGDKEFIGPAYEAIASLYPNDEAIGYRAGDLRGMWRIDFEK